MSVKDFNKTEFVLQKLGEAFYKHKRRIKTAEDASKSVDYLAGRGVIK
jgi:hypothetical protein